MNLSLGQFLDIREILLPSHEFLLVDQILL